MKQFLILLLIVGSIILPYDVNGLVLTNAQTLSSQIDLSDQTALLNSLQETLAKLDRQGTITLNDLDKADWDASTLSQKNLSEYDKKIVTQLLPALTGPNGLALRSVVVDRIRRGYTGKDIKSWETAGASNNSQHRSGKAISLVGIGTTSCAAETLFPRNLDPQKTLWVHYQNQVADKATERWPFGRAFDTVARQFFWIEGRSFTNRPITSLTWTNFLQQIAKGEIEERFGITPGALANTAVSDLDVVVAQARLARALNLPEIPTATSEATFYENLGRRMLEIELSLPRNSFNGTSRRQIAQQVGIRVLEQQLSLPEDTGNEILVDTTTFFTTDPRFLQLKKRLEERGENYIDPRIGFSLPPEEYFATGEGQSIFQRLISGDPDAFAIVGTYFLADSLELSPDDTRTLLNNTNQVAEDLPDLPIDKARPIDPNLSADRLLAGPLDQQAALFETIGRTLVPQIKAQLPLLNESVLRSLSTTNKVPSYESIIGIITDSDKRSEAIQKLAASSVVDANYISGFTIANLRDRGMTILSHTINVDIVDLQQLETNETDTENVTTTQNIADTIDNAMGWPTGTARKLTLRGAQGAADESLLSDGELLQIGASMLWDRLGLPEVYKSILNRYYFSSNLTDLTPLPNNDPELDTPSTDEVIIDENAGEIIEEIEDGVTALAIPAQDNTTVATFTEALNITRQDVELLLAGRMFIALPRITIAQIGNAIAFNTESFDKSLLLSLFNHTATAFSEEDFTAVEIPAFLQTTFADNLQQALSDKDNYLLWDTFHREAVYQWNVSCSDKRQETWDAIARLIDYLVSLPSSETSTSTPPTRPYQILTYNMSVLSEETEAKIKTAYPDADGDTYKWGVYNNPRDWDHIYIGY
jgi:hypothetical protein